jgi:hypothetical protein
MDAWAWLREGSIRGETAVFAQSSHGTQIGHAAEATEPDGYDEALVPFDFDGTRETALTDDCMRALVSGMPGPVVLILDTCYSGGMMDRGMPQMQVGKIRALDPDGEKEQGYRPEATDQRLQTRGHRIGRMASVAPSARERTLGIFACSEGETASECHVDGRTEGAFSYHASLVLDRRLPGLTWRGLVEQTTRMLRAAGFRQTPTITGSEAMMEMTVDGE